MNVFNKFLDLFITIRVWFESSQISLYEKVTYLLNSFITMCANKKSIHFLGKNFIYESRYTPFLLGMYPKEITTLLKYAQVKKIKPQILDIGANVGQWGRCLLYYFPTARLHSFEPNRHILQLLKSNAKDYQNWKIFPFGIGSNNQLLPLYYSKGSSEGGSFISSKKQNKEVVESQILLLNRINIKKYGLCSAYDIVKVDVEGMEKDVLRGLKEIKFSVLSVEVDTGRGFGITVEEAKHILNEEQQRNMMCVYISRAHNKSPEGNAIFVQRAL